MIAHLVSIQRLGPYAGVRQGYRGITLQSLYWVGRSRVSKIGVEANCYLGEFDCPLLGHPGIKLNYL